MIPPGKRHSVRLCATFVRTVSVPGRYGDGYGGRGLSLRVTPRKSGGMSKIWAQAISPNGTKTSLGLESYPVVTLAMARERALANARAIAEGRDPRRRMQQVPTFAQANETVIAIHAKHRNLLSKPLAATGPKADFGACHYPVRAIRPLQRLPGSDGRQAQPEPPPSPRLRNLALSRPRRSRP